MYGVCANIPIKNVAKHSNPLMISDLEIERSWMAGLLFSPLLQDLTFLSSFHLPD